MAEKSEYINEEYDYLKTGDVDVDNADTTTFVDDKEALFTPGTHPFLVEADFGESYVISGSNTDVKDRCTDDCAIHQALWLEDDAVTTYKYDDKHERLLSGLSLVSKFSNELYMTPAPLVNYDCYARYCGHEDPEHESILITQWEQNIDDPYIQQFMKAANEATRPEFMAFCRLLTEAEHEEMKTHPSYETYQITAVKKKVRVRTRRRVKIRIAVNECLQEDDTSCSNSTDVDRVDVVPKVIVARRDSATPEKKRRRKYTIHS